MAINSGQTMAPWHGLYYLLPSGVRARGFPTSRKRERKRGREKDRKPRRIHNAFVYICRRGRGKGGLLKCRAVHCAAPCILIERRARVEVKEDSPSANLEIPPGVQFYRVRNTNSNSNRDSIFLIRENQWRNPAYGAYNPQNG